MTQFDKTRLADTASWAADVGAEAHEHYRRLAEGEATFGYEDAQLLGSVKRIADAADRLHAQAKDAGIAAERS